MLLLPERTRRGHLINALLYPFSIAPFVPHPWFAVYCMFGSSSAKTASEAKTRLQTVGKEINEKTIEAEIKLIHKEKKIAELKSSPLFQPVCQLTQELHEWSGTPKQFKELLSARFPDDLKKLPRSPARLVEELKKIVPALQEEGIAVGVPPDTPLVTLTRAVK